VDRLYPFTVATPAGTAILAPVTMQLPLEDALLEKITIIIPDGHVGLTGIRLQQAGQQIVPWGNFNYLVANNRVIEIPFNGEMTGTGLVALSYNLDVFDHNHYLEILIKDLPLASALAVTGQSNPVILPAPSVAQLDPLSPDALLASLPDDFALPSDLTDLTV